MMSSHARAALHAKSAIWVLLLSAIALAATGCGAGAKGSTASERCRTVPACIERLHVLANQRSVGKIAGMRPEESALSEVMRGLPDAQNALVPLLSHPNDEVAELASYILRDIKTIDARHLPAIEAGLDRGLGWLPPALARIGTDEAARSAVARFLISDTSPGNQEAYALEVFGERALPHIVAAARCASGCRTDRDHHNLADVLARLGPTAAPAVPGLLSIAEDDTTPDDIAAGAVDMIAAIGAAAGDAQTTLRSIAERRPALAPNVRGALIAIRSSEAGRLLGEQLRRAPDTGMIADTAKLGHAARAAAPALIALLSSEDLALRRHAARALGYLGDPAAAEALIAVLQDPSDVNANWAAARSLGGLNAEVARDALDTAARTHWHPEVRAAAKAALVTIGQAPRIYSLGPDRFEFFHSLEDSRLDCRKPDIVRARKPQPGRLQGKGDHKRLSRLKYRTTILSYGPPEEAEPNVNGVITMTEETMVRHETAFEMIPEVALRVDGGWLAGGSRGEWGGELMWLGDDGQRTRLLDENVSDIVRLGRRIVVVTGRAHLFNDGMVYAIAPHATDGRLQARAWRALPAAPMESAITRDGRLLVVTSGGGAVLIGPDGRMEMAPCRQGKR